MERCYCHPRQCPGLEDVTFLPLCPCGPARASLVPRRLRAPRPVSGTAWTEAGEEDKGMGLGNKSPFLLQLLFVNRDFCS